MTAVQLQEPARRAVVDLTRRRLLERAMVALAGVKDVLETEGEADLLEGWCFSSLLDCREALEEFIRNESRVRA
jgi:hypothetical protein